MGGAAMERVEVGQYLVVDPEICHGQLTFKGTRVPVDTIFAYLEKGYSFEKLQASWPEVEREAIIEALQLASRALQERHGARMHPPKPIRSAAS
jgi:uncharacterized protein (DUF433 family)